LAAFQKKDLIRSMNTSGDGARFGIAPPFNLADAIGAFFPSTPHATQPF
jgi:hypothetical protein